MTSVTMMGFCFCAFIFVRATETESLHQEVKGEGREGHTQGGLNETSSTEDSGQANGLRVDNCTEAEKGFNGTAEALALDSRIDLLVDSIKSNVNMTKSEVLLTVHVNETEFANVTFTFVNQTASVISNQTISVGNHTTTTGGNQMVSAGNHTMSAGNATSTAANQTANVPQKLKN